MIPMGQWLATRPQPAPPAVLMAEHLQPGATNLPVAAPPPPAEELLATARAEGFEAGKAEAEAAFAARFEEQQAVAEADKVAAVAAAREAWCAEQAEVLEERLTRVMATLDLDLSRAVAASLEPLLESHVRQKAVSEFEAALRRLAQQGALIKLEAAADLVAALKARPGGLPAGVDVQVAAHGDMLAAADATLIESAIETWIAGLREALA